MTPEPVPDDPLGMIHDALGATVHEQPACVVTFAVNSLLACTS